MRSRVYRSVRVARRAVLTALVLTALVLAAPGTVRAAPTWHVETLDRPVAGLVLSNTSVAYGDQLHVFTGIVTERMAGVRHEWWDGTRWHVENLIGPDNQFASVPVVTVFNGQLHAFMGTSGNYGPSHVKHVWWDGTQWHAEILDGVGSAWPGHHEVASSPSAVIVYNGQLHLLAGGESGLFHDWWDGTRWNFETLDGTGSSWPGHTTDRVECSAASVYNGQLHLFCADFSTPAGVASSLRHDWWDGTRWNFETLDGVGSAWPGHTTDPVSVTNGVVYNAQLHLLIHDQLSDTTGCLRHAWWDGARWNFETLDGRGSTWPGHTTDNVGTYNAVTVYNGQLHLFTDTTVGQAVRLRHDWWDGTRWNFELFDGGRYNSVAVFGGQLHVVTQDPSTFYLLHEWWG